MGKLFLLLLAIPLFETWFLIQVGSKIGAWPTIGLVILTAMIGSALVRHQGISKLHHVQRSIAQQQIPATELLEGIMILLAGALLITPGFFTDAVGFFCLWPTGRKMAIRTLLARGIFVQTGQFNQTRARANPTQQDHPHRPSAPGPQIIDGEYTRDD